MDLATDSRSVLASTEAWINTYSRVCCLNGCFADCFYKLDSRANTTART